ncbi:MAG: hypothetical protein KA184_11565 [Candidatus Hydrogenedentes bacterium]|nr:hypothetical protein [Candidatus Hydrogenedentota bacterium]
MRPKRIVKTALVACVIATTVVLGVAGHYWNQAQLPSNASTETAPAKDMPSIPTGEPNARSAEAQAVTEETASDEPELSADAIPDLPADSQDTKVL